QGCCKRSASRAWIGVHPVRDSLSTRGQALCQGGRMTVTGGPHRRTRAGRRYGLAGMLITSVAAVAVLASGSAQAVTQVAPKNTAEPAITGQVAVGST